MDRSGPHVISTVPLYHPSREVFNLINRDYEFMVTEAYAGHRGMWEEILGLTDKCHRGEKCHSPGHCSRKSNGKHHLQMQNR